MLKHHQLSYWEQKTYLSEVDHIIIGAGIVGLSTAIHIKKKRPNSKVLILERGYLPSGASSKNAGFACFGSPTELWDDLSHITADEVWSTVEKRFAGLNYLKEMIGEKNLKFEQNGSWDLIIDQSETTYLETKKLLPYLNENIKQITGESNVYSVDSAVAQKFGFQGVETSFYNRLEAQIDTASMNRSYYLLALETGVEILFDHEVIEIESGGMKQIIHTNHGDIATQQVFITTNGFAKKLLPELDVEPARAQVIITEPIQKLKIKGTFHYDMGYYYFRNIDNRILLGGGRNLDFKGENTAEMVVTEKITEKLNQLLRKTILPNQEVHIDHKWSGIMGVGKNKTPIIREISSGIFCGVRMGGMGVAIGSLVGKELAESI